MVDDGEYRSIGVKVSTGEVSFLDTISSASITEALEDPTKQAAVLEKYGITSIPTLQKTGNELRDMATYFFEMAKTMLKLDGHHVFAVMLFTPSNRLSSLNYGPRTNPTSTGCGAPLLQ